jgi:hypothetical protein
VQAQLRIFRIHFLAPIPFCPLFSKNVFNRSTTKA